ncbi:hypothetical protein GIB67_031776 [Kingdonia uniflora]|uniref:Uncharacterized protein n=1 Tax=Kingdonia uniflora TaxID=39325 RepID=A0A7J7L4G8_9MAGN|nr:hypothetical protein GIB67_031776 [Kingdonia uniflora]
MPRLKHLTVTYCWKLKQMRALGNSKVLETLRINDTYLLRLGQEFLGALNGKDGRESMPTVVFQKLKELQFEGMCEWKEWEMMITKDIPIVPYLREIKRHYCPMLKSLPECIMSSSSIRNLVISDGGECCAIYYVKGPFDYCAHSDWSHLVYGGKTRLSDLKNPNVKEQSTFALVEEDHTKSRMMVLFSLMPSRTKHATMLPFRLSSNPRHRYLSIPRRRFLEDGLSRMRHNMNLLMLPRFGRNSMLAD